MSPGSASGEKSPLLLWRPGSKNYVLVIHGGAGSISRAGSSAQQRAQYKAALNSALRAGYAVLRDGGEAIDAAVAAVTAMEDCPLFNAGKGAVFNVDGKNELEASLMLSKPPASHPALAASRRGVGLTLLTHTRNPSHLARLLYLAPGLVPHTMLSGPTAESIGESLGLEPVDPSYFFTESRWKEHRRGLGLPEEPFPLGHSPSHPPTDVPLDQMPTGTVGAVALDIRGCIAAITSTGGKTNKLVGRIGDTPQMGSGFWAEEWKVTRLWSKIRGKKVKAVGVSGTGDGDYFIRQATASTVAHRMRFLYEPLKKAAQCVVEELRKDGAPGGVIALDRNGKVAMVLNCSGMYRGVIRNDGVAKTAIFADEDLA